MMLSNFRQGLRNCRPTTTSFLTRTLNHSENSSWNSTKISRSYSFDVAPLLGEISRENVNERSRIRPKTGTSSSGKAKSSFSKMELPHWVQTPVDLMMYKAENSSDLWKLAAKFKLTGLQTVGFLATLAKMAASDSELNYEKIQSDSSTKECFDVVVQSLISEYESLPVGNIVLAFRSLLFLGVPADHELLERLREKLLKNFNILGSGSLLTLAAFHVKYADLSQSSKNLQVAMEDAIRSRMADYSDPNDLLLILSMVKRQDSSAWFREIESKLLTVIPNFSGDHLARLLNSLASKRSRSLTLLKAIVNRYAHCEDDLPIKKLATILSDLSTLNYPNLKMITAVLRDIESKLQTVTKPSVICGIFSSLAIMRLRHLDLLQAMCQWTHKNLDSFTPSELVSVLVALARCNYVPTETKDAKEKADLIMEISKKISSKQFEDEKLQWLDAVWSLSILGRLSKEHAASVLEKSFYEVLLKNLSGNDYKLAVAQLKLRNVSTAARLEVPGYKGPYLDQSALSEIKQINIVQYKEESVKVLTNALNHLAPSDKYMKTEVTCPEGYVVDALLRMNADGKPVPISEWEKPLSNSWPVAVVLRHFNDITQLSDSVIGVHAMATRHLTSLGYLVLEIPSLEIEQRRQVLTRVQFLKEKLDSAVQKMTSARSD